MRRSTAAVCAAAVVAAAAVLSPGSAVAADGRGKLDPTFSSDGKAVASVSGVERASGVDVVVQGSGKVVTAVRVTRAGKSSFGVSRLARNGRPDRSFSGDGSRTTGFTGNDVPYRVVRLGRGRVLVGGSAGGSFGLAAYRGDGSMDRSFGVRGKVVTELAAGPARVLDLRVQPDGAILAAGPAGDQFAVVRYLADGTRDPSFGVDGVVLTTDGFAGEALNLRLQADGRLLAVGETGPTGPGGVTGFAVSRFDPDGSLDESFGGGDGRVETYPPGREGSRAYAVLVQPDGRIVVGGTAFGEGDYSRFAVGRYLPDGTPDPGFGEDGVTVHFVKPYYARIHALAQQQDGKIVAAGWTGGEGTALVVSRYRTDGTLDETLSGDGVTLVRWAGDRYGQGGVAVTPWRDRLVSVGTRYEQAHPTRSAAVAVRLRQ